MATTPNQLTSQKLEENPVLPLDTQANLVYTLTRIFRLLAQIVNPLVAWASTFVNVRVINDAWGSMIEVKPTAPSGQGAGIALDGQAPTGQAMIQGKRGGLVYWQQLMPFPDAQGDFVIQRFNAPGTYAGETFRMSRTTGNAQFGGIVYAYNGFRVNPATTGYASIILAKRGANQSNDIQGQKDDVIRWLMQIGDPAAESGGNVGSHFQIHRYSDAGAWLGTPLSINRASGQATLTSATSEKTVLIIADSGTGQGGNIQLNNASWGSRWLRVNVNGEATFINNTYNTETHRFTNTGDTFTTGPFSTTSWNGLSVNSSNGVSGQYAYQQLLWGNPSWASTILRSWHQNGLWAGFQMVGNNACAIEFYLSNAGSWGSIKAAAFDVQSDERIKDDVQPLPQQHDAYMGIVPVSWYWPVPAQPKDADTPPIYADTRQKWGFSAQNLSLYVPLAVNGSVVAKNPDGKPLSASIDPIPISALTVLEVQALWAHVQDLEARVAALESA